MVAFTFLCFYFFSVVEAIQSFYCIFEKKILIVRYKCIFTRNFFLRQTVRYKLLEDESEL